MGLLAYLPCRLVSCKLPRVSCSIRNFIAEFVRLCTCAFSYDRFFANVCLFDRVRPLRDERRYLRNDLHFSQLISRMCLGDGVHVSLRPL